MGRTAYAQAVQGPLASYALGFEEELKWRGYAVGSVRGRLRQFDDLSRWLKRRDLAPGEVDGGVGGFVPAGAPCRRQRKLGLTTKHVAPARVPALGRRRATAAGGHGCRGPG